MGYLLVNITVLGPNDEPYVHDVSTEKSADASKEKSMVPSKIKHTPHSVNIRVFRGEHMAPLDMSSPEYVLTKIKKIKLKGLMHMFLLSLLD